MIKCKDFLDSICYLLMVGENNSPVKNDKRLLENQISFYKVVGKSIYFFMDDGQVLKLEGKLVEDEKEKEYAKTY